MLCGEKNHGILREYWETYKYRVTHNSLTHFKKSVHLNGGKDGGMASPADAARTNKFGEFLFLYAGRMLKSFPPFKGINFVKGVRQLRITLSIHYVGNTQDFLVLYLVARIASRGLREAKNIKYLLPTP
jgi:hypothetical protein